MKNEFVSYEIALALKELRFNEECLTTYGNKGKSFHRNPSESMDGYPRHAEPLYWKNSLIHKDIVAAPLWQQVIDFFREKYQIEVSVIWLHTSTAIGKTEVKGYLPYCNGIQFDKEFKTYEEAREAAILKAIEICKQKK